MKITDAGQTKHKKTAITAFRANND